MRTHTAPELALILGHYNLYAQLDVEDPDGAYKDVTALSGINWFKSLDVTNDVDQAVQSIRLTLRREAGGKSIAPLLVASLLNRNAANAYAPLLYANRKFKLRTACTAVGVAPVAGDWKEILQGRVDSLDWASSDSTVQLVGRDPAGILQDTFIEVPTIYSVPAGTAVQTVIQQIFTQWAPAPTPTLYVPVDPLWQIKDYLQYTVSVWQAALALARQRGWELKYKYDAAHVFRPTLYDPRAPKAVPDATIGPTHYHALPGINIDDSNVRNVIRVFYRP